MITTKATATRSLFASALTAALVGLGTGNALALTAEDLASVPVIDWSALKAPTLTEAQKTMPQVLANSNEYALGAWWQKKFSGQDSNEYLNFGGRTVHNIRHPAAQAMALATALQTGTYDAAITGVSEEEARARTIKLIASLAKAHAANTTNGWSGPQVTQTSSPVWQSALWASSAATAGWFLWEDLSAEQQQLVGKMVEYEGNRFLGYQTPVWKTWDGVDKSPGNSLIEENSWNALVVQMASVMFPKHANREAWTNEYIEMMVGASAMARDAQSTELVNGKTVKEWVSGYNVQADGTVINHGFMHPDYMAAAIQQMFALIPPSLAGQKAPAGVVHNIADVYRAFDTVTFMPPEYRQPGGTIYIPGSGDLYWPKDTDWGKSRRMNYAGFDALASVFGLDTKSTYKGDYWLKLHGDAAVKAQARSTDGRTYLSTKEDSFIGAEEWVAWHAAMATLGPIVTQNNKLNLSNEAVSELLKPVPPTIDPITRAKNELLRISLLPQPSGSTQIAATSDFGLQAPINVEWLGHNVEFFPSVTVDGIERPNYLGLPQITKSDSLSVIPRINIGTTDPVRTAAASAATLVSPDVPTADSTPTAAGSDGVTRNPTVPAIAEAPTSAAVAPVDSVTPESDSTTPSGASASVPAAGSTGAVEDPAEPGTAGDPAGDPATTTASAPTPEAAPDATSETGTTADSDD